MTNQVGQTEPPEMMLSLPQPSRGESRRPTTTRVDGRRDRGSAAARAAVEPVEGQLSAEPDFQAANESFQSPYPLVSVIGRFVPVYSTTSPRLLML